MTKLRPEAHPTHTDVPAVIPQDVAREALEALDLALFALEGAPNESEGRLATLERIRAVLKKAGRQ